MTITAPNGHPRWLAEPDDWAAVKNQRAVRNLTQPIRFQGQWHDEESGLYYNRHRYYDPQQGRYISQDPIGLKGGTNLYGYVTNPTGMVDPLGLVGPAAACAIPAVTPVCAKAGAAVGTALWNISILAIGIGINHDIGRYDTPIVEPQDSSTELPSIEPGSCRSEHPISEQSSCPSELPIIEQSGWASELPIAAPLQGDNTIGGGYQPAGTDMIGGAVFSESGSNSRSQISETRANHILLGDGTGGGHLWPGAPGKSPFPQSWSSSKVLDEINSIASNPSISGRVQGNGRIVKEAIVDGINVRVVIESPSKGGGVVTAFPTNVSRNVR